MSSPITIFKNESLFYEANNIQEAARILAEHIKTTKHKCYEPIERGYVYHIPYTFGKDVFRFVAPKEIAYNRRRELEERDHKNARRIWLVPANPNEYDVESAFSYYDKLDWKRSYNYENGDILFLYVSGNVNEVRYKTEVVMGKVPKQEVINDKVFWKVEEKYEKSKEYEHARIRLIDEVETSELSIARLRDHGLKGNIQGSMKLTGELKEYIMSFFKHDLTEGYFPEEVSESLEEGKRKKIYVNVYERNPIARKKCIEHYGIQCQVCDVDLENKYGDVGKGFIHVHHVVPLHKLQQDYIVDPKKDLIPVCPNCHAMLHRKVNGAYLSVDQLRERIVIN